MKKQVRITALNIIALMWLPVLRRLSETRYYIIDFRVRLEKEIFVLSINPV